MFTTYKHSHKNRYVRSHMDLQLAGQGGWRGYVNDQTQTQSCNPIVDNAYGNQINPCGLVAWSLFNDSYNVGTGCAKPHHGS
jgi:hypothetical protein